MSPRAFLPTLTASILLALPAGALAAAPGDRDRDGLPDAWAKTNKLFGKQQAGKDQDRDGLTNWAEWRAGTKPRKADSDRDGVGDAYEDRDRDQVDNGTELLAKTDPGDADSDGDRVKDGKEDPDRDRLDNAGEDRTGNHPRDADTDNDGVKDGDETAGTIVRIDDDGNVTIRLAGGKTVTAQMVGEPDLVCGTEEALASGGRVVKVPGSTESGDAGDDVVEELPDDENAPEETLEEVILDFEPVDGAEVEDEDVDADDGESGAEDDLTAAQQACLDALKPGAIVHDAQIETDGDGPVLVGLRLVTS